MITSGCGWSGAVSSGLGVVGVEVFASAVCCCGTMEIFNAGYAYCLLVILLCVQWRPLQGQRGAVCCNTLVGIALGRACARLTCWGLKNEWYFDFVVGFTK